ncbi:hypothetical protein M6D93_06405 [Jatrophihabitans telluris]|uniref:Uncharacterized protein n=1 Tax=Jatrophihabitans telluris TaxID=2038343 RepID=A0ABY4R304_9ACTN|nr:hypothetical protein [Jatrophihabitans telluris]UQX89631.1 hypothetical protein M6D93_06405 [Jatrophihabitans telluris]
MAGALVVAVALASVAIFIAAHKTQGRARNQAAPGAPVSASAQPSAATLTLLNGKVTEDQPPAGTTATISEDAALALYNKFANKSDKQPTSSLVLFTDQTYGGDAPLGSPARAPYNRVLAWDFLVTGVQGGGINSGGYDPGSTPSPRPLSTSANCDYHYIINATTGDDMESWITCPAG